MQGRDIKPIRINPDSKTIFGTDIANFECVLAIAKVNVIVELMLECEACKLKT